MSEFVDLHGWDGWPVHCPFCGTGVGPESVDADDVCRHLLYVSGLGQFFYLADRLADAVGLDDEQRSDAREGRSYDRELGGFDRFVNACEGFPNLVRFRCHSAVDTGEVAFAAEPDELHAWGQVPLDPRR